MKEYDAGISNKCQWNRREGQKQITYVFSTDFNKGTKNTAQGEEGLSPSWDWRKQMFLKRPRLQSIRPDNCKPTYWKGEEAQTMIF